MGKVVQLDLFRVATAEPPWRDNRDAMEFPFLSLQKKRTKPIRYAKEGVSLSVFAPAEFGLASIWDGTSSSSRPRTSMSAWKTGGGHRPASPLCPTTASGS